MKTSLIVKLNFLILGLGLTSYLIFSLNRGGLSPRILEILGIQPTQNAEFSLDWCDTRVEALIRPEKFKLQQEGRVWQIEGHEAKIVDFISVEKWFGKNCSVAAKRIRNVDSIKRQVAPELFVKFVNGQVEVLKRIADGIFEWKGEAFASEELEGALHELERLPAASARGGSTPAAFIRGNSVPAATTSGNSVPETSIRSNSTPAASAPAADSPAAGSP